MTQYKDIFKRFRNPENEYNCCNFIKKKKKKSFNRWVNFNQS